MNEGQSKHIYTGVLAFFIPCYVQGKNAEAVGENCLHHGLAGLVPILGEYCHAVIRGKIREQKNIEASFSGYVTLLVCVCACVCV